MSGFDSVAIIGLGLIGGSLARDLTARGVRVVAYDRDASHLTAALRTHVVASALDESLEGIRDVEVVVIATPVNAAADLLRRIAPSASKLNLITDVGSTKAPIVEAARELGLADRFVGGHPMAGDHRSGWDASRTGLFVNAPVYVCANPEVNAAAMELAQGLWRSVGACPERMSADQHDLKLAWTSHLPHMISASLALALARAGITREHLGPGGRDVTRLAGSSPEMWTAIAIENAEAIEGALERAEREIATLRSAIKRADQEELNARLTAAKQWFDE